MFVTDLFKLCKKCHHTHVTADQECSYCPDCGKLIKNEWYITRCACCGQKLKTRTRDNEILPYSRYCTNCGSNEFVVEKLNEINFIDINFAALLKTVVDEANICSTTQFWQENTQNQLKLFVNY